MLVVWKLDRLARSVQQLIETVQKLDDKGVQFKSLTENLDTTFGQQVLDVAKAEGKPKIQPDSMLNNCSRKSMAGI